MDFNNSRHCRSCKHLANMMFTNYPYKIANFCSMQNVNGGHPMIDSNDDACSLYEEARTGEQNRYL